MPTRRTLLARLGAGLGSAALLPGTVPAARALTPAARGGAVALVSGAAEGTAADQWVRAFAPFLERHLPRRPVTVAGRAGLGGLAVLRDLAGESGDGAALGYASTPELPARVLEQGAAALLGRVRFLGAVSEEPLVLVAPPGTELAALRRPGGSGVLALPPPGSAAALAAAFLEGEMNLAPLHFPSGAAARQAAVAGNVSAALVRTGEAAAPLRDGRLMGLGIASAAPCPAFPGVPTLAEQGIRLVASSRRGFILSAAAPESEAQSLAAALRAAVADPEYVAQAEAAGAVPAFLDEAGWTAQVRRELALLGQLWQSEPWLARVN